jgi:hypothetical protein
MSHSVVRRGSWIAAFWCVAGCATTSGVIVNPNIQHADYRSVYIVVHGGDSADMDNNLKREFRRHRLAVLVGPDGVVTSGTQLVARYTYVRQWDMEMQLYLRSLDVMVFDAKSNVLLASGSSTNNTFHKVRSSEEVVAEVVDDTLSDLRGLSSPRRP